ncbi:hypothetical protein N9T40_00810 [Pelagibacteraceae bacterium]|nr:hypothetical protein [Pelagibacteraceae bacterium]
MNDKKKTVKDSYGRLIENKSFDEYWDEFHKIENLSMKESIRQKNERKSKIKDKQLYKVSMKLLKATAFHIYLEYNLKKLTL